MTKCRPAGRSHPTMGAVFLSSCGSPCAARSPQRAAIAKYRSPQPTASVDASVQPPIAHPVCVLHRSPESARPSPLVWSPFTQPESAGPGVCPPTGLRPPPPGSARRVVRPPPCPPRSVRSPIRNRPHCPSPSVRGPPHSSLSVRGPPTRVRRLELSAPPEFAHRSRPPPPVPPAQEPSAHPETAYPSRPSGVRPPTQALFIHRPLRSAPKLSVPAGTLDFGAGGHPPEIRARTSRPSTSPTAPTNSPPSRGRTRLDSSGSPSDIRVAP